MSVTPPLWAPFPVELGAVGYLCKPNGEFITLFNAYDPRKSDHPGIQDLPSIHSYGAVKDDLQRLPEKTLTQRALDIIDSLKSRNSSDKIARRHSFSLKAGHQAAYLYTEIAEYCYMVTLEAPKKWFQSNVDAIMNIYGYQHHIQKEDLLLIIGNLVTPNYALLMSHRHPEGDHVHFNVLSNPKIGQPWGTFTTETDEGHRHLEEPDETQLSARKVSNHGAGRPWDSILLARLRFKPEISEPTFFWFTDLVPQRIRIT